MTTTADGRWLLAAIEPTSQLAVIDLKTNQVARTITLPGSPHETVLSMDGKMAYVSCSVAGEVWSIRTKDWAVRKSISSGPFVDGLAWAQRAAN